MSVCLTDLLQQFILNEFKLHTDGHFGDELVTSFLGHLFAVSQVDMANASTALEIGQRLVCDPVTDCREKLDWKKNLMVYNRSPALKQTLHTHGLISLLGQELKRSQYGEVS